MIVYTQSIEKNLSELILSVSTGRIQLPEFQRNWRWDDVHIRSIIASISQGFPINAIMRLEYGNPNVRFKYRTIEGVQRTNNDPEFLVLDGQQRLTSLYQATYSHKAVQTISDRNLPIARYYYLDMEKSVEPNEDRFDAIISIPEDKKLKKNFDRDIVLDLSERDKEYEHKCFPLNVVFHPHQLMEWGTGYVVYHTTFDDYEKQAKAMEIYKKFFSDVISTITGYKLPVTTLDKNTPKEAICKIFEIVNTGGVPLTVFELVTAMYAADDWDLRKDWENCKSVIRGKGDTYNTDLMEEIDETAFLTTVTLYTSYVNKINGRSSKVSCKKRDVLDLEFKDYKDNREAVLSGYKIAREFLQKYLYVFQKRDLPYTTQLIPLAAICAYLGGKKCNEPNTTKILSRWYWCGVFGEMYGGANESRYANDIEDVVNEVLGKESLNRTVNAAFFSSIRLLTMQTRVSAAYKGIIALLYKGQCHDFMNATVITLLSIMEKTPDLHHIFPQKYCDTMKLNKQKYNSIVNKTPILPETNRAIGGYAPSIYISHILKKVKDLSEETLRKRIESHFIDYDALKSDDFDAHFIARAKKLLDAIEDAMGKKIADRNADITIQQFGCSLE